MTDIVAILFFLIRSVMIIGVVVLFIVFANAAVKNVDIFTLQKTTGEAANLMMESSLADGRAIFDEEKLSALDSSDEEPVRFCDKGIRYEFYHINQSGPGKNYTFGFMNSEEFMEVKDSTSSHVKDFNVWLKDGETIRPGKMRIIVFYNELTKFVCAAEHALVKVSVDSFVSCPVMYEQLQNTRGLDYSQQSSCVIYEGDNDNEGKICLRISLDSLSQTPGGSGEFEICRKSDAIFAGKVGSGEAGGVIDEDFDFYDKIEITLRKQGDLRDFSNKEVGVVVG